VAKMTPFKKAVVKTGTYTDRDGNEKARYLNVGVLFKYEDGGLALKLEAMPVGDGWNGFVSFFDMDDKKGAGQRSSGGTSSGQSRRESYDLNDDIPFVRTAGDHEA
jgi:hypothetical protein